jgi:hypothetical protein
VRHFRNKSVLAREVEVNCPDLNLCCYFAFPFIRNPLVAVCFTMVSAPRAAISITTPQKPTGKPPSGSPYGRKPPHCSVCKRPRKGHPRRICADEPLSGEMWDVPTPKLSSYAPKPSRRSPEVDNITTSAAKKGHPGVAGVALNPGSLTDALSITGDAVAQAEAKARRSRRRIMPGTLSDSANDYFLAELPRSQRTEACGSDGLDEYHQTVFEPSITMRRPTD